MRRVLFFLLLFAVLFLVCGCNGCGNNTATLKAVKAHPEETNGTLEREVGDTLERETCGVLEREYFSVEDATFHEGAFPSATIDRQIEGLSLNSQALTGGLNFITIVTDEEYDGFYIGAEGVDGYFSYIPADEVRHGYNSYSIPVLYSTKYDSDITMLISGKKKTGDITKPNRERVQYMESQSGALNINLTFSNAKDIDLHLYMPDGTHIYHGNRSKTATTADGNTVTFGLDHDSNAGCDIDNLNNENIYIPEEVVQNGTYRVVVNLYRNCDPVTATSWAVVTRYKGDVIPVRTGHNPATGVYPVGAYSGDMTEVMIFTIDPR